MPADLPPFDRDAMRYLLGQTSEEEAAAFEARLLEEDLSEDLAGLEDELIDRYVRGELGADEREAFERNLEARPGREEKIAFARALIARVDRVATVLRPPRWRRTLLLAGVAAAAGLAACLILALLVRRTRDAPRGDPQRVPAVAQAPERPKELPPALPPPIREERPSAAEPPVLLALALSQTRAAGEALLSIPAGATVARLQIDLEGERDFASFNAVFHRLDGSEAWSAAHVQGDAKAGLLELRIPAGVLAPGRYRLSISGIGARGKLRELSVLPLRVAGSPAGR